MLGHFLNTHFRKFEAIVNKLHKTVRNDFINLYDKEQNSLRTLSSSKFLRSEKLVLCNKSSSARRRRSCRKMVRLENPFCDQIHLVTKEQLFGDKKVALRDTFDEATT